MAVWFCAFPFTERSIGVMGSQPDRYSATRISAVSMMSERRFEACTYEVNGVGWPIVVRVIVEHFIVANFLEMFLSLWSI